MENRSVSETVNKVATDHWIYGKPKNVFFIPKGGDDLCNLRKAGEPDGLIWVESDLKPHFRFAEFLDCMYTETKTCREWILKTIKQQNK